MATTDYEAVPAVEGDDAAPHLGTVVMKFGGTSVADPDKLKNVAGRLVAAREGGSRVVAVLSAMGSTTDALAAALGAQVCEVYTDVDGVYSADPRLVPNARKLDALTYEEMLEMASSGARVMATRSIEVARSHNVRLHVRSTFNDAEGTWIREEDGTMLEKALISGVVHQREETVYRVTGANASRLFGKLADASVNVDTIVQTGAEIVFSAPVEDRPDAARALDELGVSWSARDDLGKVSLVGAGMKSHPGVAAKTFATLEAAGIDAPVVSTSPIKIACHVPSADVQRAVQALHEAFELG